MIGNMEIERFPMYEKLSEVAVDIISIHIVKKDSHYKRYPKISSN